MKILLTADTVGGVWTYAVELIRGLAQHNVEVALCTMGSLPSSEQHAELEDLDNIELFTSEYKLEWMAEPWEDVRRAGDWLLRIENRIKPDVIHLNGYAHGSLPWRAPVLIVGHSCVLSWWQAVKGETAPGEWDRYRQEVSNGLRAAGLVFAPTQAMLSKLDKYYGPFRSSKVIPNARDAALFPIGKKEPFIFTAGRIWDEAKNIAALENIAPELNWPICVAGNDEHPNGEIIHNQNIRLLGKVPPQALHYWFARASIYALPAKYEPFGLSILEAALTGCALVLSDIDSLREIWEDTALFVPPDDVDALRECINRLIADDAKRTSLANRSRERALEFNPERMVQGYLNAYNSLIGNAANV